MSDVIAATQPRPASVHPPAISVREVSPWALFGVALVALLYMVGVEQGAMVNAGNMLHEWMHDGRHLLGFPCH